MGCCGSKTTDTKQATSGSRTPQPKAPIRLFYLPGNVKIQLTKLVSASVMGSETTATTTAGINLNARFIDVPNQRSVRRYWGKEISKNTEAAMSIYLADIREPSTMLLNVKTLNWFLKQIGSKEQANFYVVVICSNAMQITEFRARISYKQLELVIIKDNDPETVIGFTELVTNEIIKYNDKKKKYDVSPRSR